jgi:Tfp pilus assembly protein PilX
LRNKKGSALTLVMFVMVLLTILGLTLLTVSLAEAKAAIRQEKKVQAYFIAKSGADAYAKAYMDAPESVNTSTPYINQPLGEGHYNVMINEFKDPVDGKVTDVDIISTGVVGDTQETVF